MTDPIYMHFFESTSETMTKPNPFQNHPFHVVVGFIAFDWKPVERYEEEGLHWRTVYLSVNINFRIHLWLLCGLFLMNKCNSTQNILMFTTCKRISSLIIYILCYQWIQQLSVFVQNIGFCILCTMYFSCNLSDEVTLADNIKFGKISKIHKDFAICRLIKLIK